MSGHGQPQPSRKRKATVTYRRVSPASSPLAWDSGNFDVDDTNPLPDQPVADAFQPHEIGSYEHIDSIAPDMNLSQGVSIRQPVHSQLVQTPPVRANTSIEYDTEAVPVFVFLEEELLRKIRSNAYVDFKKLAKNSFESDSDSESEFIEVNGFLKKSKKEKREKLSFLDWQIAFNIFSTARVESDPNSALGLLKHQQQVLKLVRSRGDWRGYDKKFRKLVALGHAHWGSVKAEIYSEASTTHYVLAPQQNLRAIGIKEKLCFSYHKKGFCPAAASGSRCQFSHVCPKCKLGLHPAYKCYSFSSQNQSRQAHRGRGFSSRGFYSQASSAPRGFQSTNLSSQRTSTRGGALQPFYFGRGQNNPRQ